MHHIQTTLTIPCKIKLPILLAAALIAAGSAPRAAAGLQHARSIVQIKNVTSYALENGIAEATAQVASAKRVSHEETGLNYTYGNAGVGHAHHHALFNARAAATATGPVGRKVRPPRLGAPGTSQHVVQTWRPDAARRKITVAWEPMSFLQVDPAEVKPGHSITSSASLAADGGLSGSVALTASVDAKGAPHFSTRLAGAFRGSKVSLVRHANGVVSLQLRRAPSWTVPGVPASFDVELEGSITPR